jgi:homoserine kinase type II
VTFVRNTPVLVRRWLPGRTYDDLPARHLGAAGGLLAALHGCDVADLDVPVGNRRLHAALRAVLDDFPNQAHADWIRHRLARLDQSFPDPDTARRPQWRIVHGDFHGPNIVVAASGRLAVIDWETATVDDPMLDVGMAVVGLCGSGGRLDQSRVRRFLAGYAASGGVVEPRLLGPAVEYAGVILAFHRYRRHHMRFPDPTRHGYFQEMVTFVEREFPADGAGEVTRVGRR